MRGRPPAHARILLCALACAFALTTPVSAHAVALRAPALMPLTADVPVEASATDLPGIGMLYVDGGLAASAEIVPSRTTTFTAVSFQPGVHRLRVLVRTTSGIAASAVTTVGCWGTPPPPTLPWRGLYPERAVIPVRVEGADRLTVLLDGRRVSSKSIGTPSTSRLALRLTPGSHALVLHAANPLATTSVTYTLTRPVWPLPGHTRITSTFGWRVHPILGTRRFHAGLDIAAPSGSHVVASGPATVAFAGVNGGYGNCVILDHGGGVTTLHGHLSRIDVRAGQKVSIGQRIGLVGSTGLSTGPHLHYELRVDDTACDPLGYL